MSLFQKDSPPLPSSNPDYEPLASLSVANFESRLVLASFFLMVGAALVCFAGPIGTALIPKDHFHGYSLDAAQERIVGVRWAGILFFATG